MSKSTETIGIFPSKSHIDYRADTSEVISNLVNVYEGESCQPDGHHNSFTDAATTYKTTGGPSSSDKDVTIGDDTDISYPDSTTPPPTFEDVDRWNYHIDLQNFGASLQAAARAIYPNEQKSRYSKVTVLMLRWADEDPQLPVSQEIGALQEVFRDDYNFDTELWNIPDLNSHYKLAEKIMQFIKPEEDGSTHLKILYYAGHARLMETRTLAWTSWRNKKKATCPTVKWGAIQSFLEEASNDVLILLDCCASGTANTCEGNGTTELISACAWNETANGVGPYSFTSVLVIELKRLSQKASFSVGELYRNVFMRTQNRMPEDIPREGRERERHPAPIHLTLTQDTHLPRSIRLSVRVNTEIDSENIIPAIQNSEQPTGSALPYIQEHNNDPSVCSNTITEYSPRIAPHEKKNNNNNSIKRPLPTCGMAPRLAFAVRLSDTFRPDEDIKDLFLEWLRNIPAIAKEVKIEASFASFSTLMVLSLPISMSAYLPRNPAIMSLGPITSGNRLLHAEDAQVNSRDLSWKYIEVEPSGTLDTELATSTPPWRSMLPNPASPTTTKAQNPDMTALLQQHSDLLSIAASPSSELSPSSSSGSTGPPNFKSSLIEQASPPFNPTEVIYRLQTADGQIIRPEIFGKIDKGFFMADNDWTYNRRNYFSLTCSYTLHPVIPNGTVHLVQQGGSPLQVYDFAISIAAVVNGRDGKAIELVQYIPKRDKGPQEKPPRITLAPRPPPTLGIYGNNSGLRDASRGLYDQGYSLNANQQAIEAIFERIQFKSATANNGKRRAAQQYYHLLVELFADIGQQYPERWIRIATRMSAPLVVRGRSPGHYQNEPRESNASAGPGGSDRTGGEGAFYRVAAR